MTIRERIEDADFLVAHGRSVGALAMIMVAIASTSRKRFPKGTPSIDDPAREMGDGEAFKAFLGGRIADLMLFRHNRGTIGPSGISIEWNGQPRDLACLLYKYYRCGNSPETSCSNRSTR